MNESEPKNPESVNASKKSRNARHRRLFMGKDNPRNRNENQIVVIGQFIRSSRHSEYPISSQDIKSTQDLWKLNQYDVKYREFEDFLMTLPADQVISMGIGIVNQGRENQFYVITWQALSDWMKSKEPENTGSDYEI